MKRLSILLLLATIFVGCGSQDYKVTSSGKPYEIIVVAPLPMWDGIVGDTLRSIFGAEVEMINQPEPLYDLLIVPPLNFNKVADRHRNIIVLRTSKNIEQSTMNAEIDPRARPQLQINIQAPSDDSMANFIGHYSDELLSMFNIAERDRMKDRAMTYTDRVLTNDIKERFGFNMSIPQGYYLASDKPGFMWIRYEMPLSSIGFVIYTYQADTVNVDYNDKAGNILANLEVALKEIPGPSDGSYMVTSRTFPPDQKRLTVQGRVWNQLRGFWEVEGDFMGGPYIDYTTYLADKGQMLGIYGYVFNPSPNSKVGKRNMIRQIEGIFMTVDIPEAKQ